MGDSNLWLPGLVEGRDARSADRACVEILTVMLRSFGLEVANPPHAPAHVRGAALDLVIAKPGFVQDVQVHNSYHCSCSNREWCCPLLGSDHFAVTIALAKSRSATSGSQSSRTRHVRDWNHLIDSQRESIEAWANRVSCHLAMAPLATRVDSREVLNHLYSNLLDIVWNAHPSLYRLPKPNSRTQPSWWTDACFDALVQRNAAWRARNRDRCDDTNAAFHAARNHFHRVVRTAKSTYWSDWLHRVERVKAFNPRVAARWVRRRFRHNICKVASNLAPSSFARACDQQHCLHQWQSHFQHAADVNADDFCRARFARVRRRVQRIRASRTCSQNVPGPPFAVEELHAALRQCEFGKTPGCDNIPYEALAVKSCWWQTAILNFLELCRISSCVPSIWKHGIVVPLAKSANSTDRNDYRPITLTCCFAKLLERLILNRVRPTIDPRLDECQAGFRYGSDVQVYALLDTLRLRQDVPTYCAFLDIRKAFDVAWRDGAMLRLHRAGVPHDLWHS